MAVFSIVRLGHPSLRAKSEPVTRDELLTKKFQKFLDTLVLTCRKANGAGIAAPQVGVNKRVIVVNIDLRDARDTERGRFPATIIVNPEVARVSAALEEDWEGDLSADIRAVVPRPKSCTVTGWDRQGQAVRYELEGFPARVFQHEIDHLDGVFLIDRVERLETLSETKEWKQYWGDSAMSS